MKEKKHIYPVEFDPELYARLKEYAQSHGKQSIGSVIRYAVSLFLADEDHRSSPTGILMTAREAEKKSED